MASYPRPAPVFKGLKIDDYNPIYEKNQDEWIVEWLVDCVQHLKRYLDEFDFRYNEWTRCDLERIEQVLCDIVGKRLTCRDSPSIMT